MKQSTPYKTKQRDAVLGLLCKAPGQHFTADQITAQLKNNGVQIGLATVYRNLNRLVAQGHIKQYQIDGSSSACFEYTGEEHDCPQHFHLKCEKCGQVIHLQCSQLTQIMQHIQKDHRFQINELKTVFYGLCNRCS